MAIEFTELPPANLPLSGNEIVAVVQDNISCQVVVNDLNSTTLAPKDAVYLTWGLDTTRLPNSRVLIAGIGIALTTVGPDQLRVSSVGGGTAVKSLVISSGNVNNIPIDPDTGFVDLDPTSGPSTVTGFTAGADGQTLVISNMGTNLITLASLNGNSSSTHQIRCISSGISLLQYMTQTLRYSSTIARWIPV